MTRVAIAWDRKTPANKVGLSKAIRKHTDAGLAEAKRCVDRCLQGEPVFVVCTESHADALIAEARNLGWTAWIVEDHDDADAWSDAHHGRTPCLVSQPVAK